MTTNERRSELIRILMGGTRTTIDRLASQLEVSRSTIKRDLLILTVDCEYPIQGETGPSGGVYMEDFRHLHKHILSQEQIRVLTEAADSAPAENAEILHGILRAYA